MALSIKDYILVGDGLLVTFSDNSVVQLTYRIIDSKLVADGDLTQEQKNVLESFVDDFFNDPNDIPLIDTRMRQLATSSSEPSGVSATTYKSYTLTTGNPDTYYVAGYYDYSSTDANLTQASTTVNYGSANNAYCLLYTSDAADE